VPCACFKAIERPKPIDVHKGRTTRTPWDPVLVQKTITTSPASQAIPHLIVAGIFEGSRPSARSPLAKLAKDVTATLDLALAASGLDQMTVVHRPRLLSDNGASYVAADLAQWLDRQEMEHVRGAPYHPQTQGKIERWHQTLKNRILLEHYYLPGDLERQVAAFVAHYNHARYHESLDNLTPADVYFGRAEAVLLERERIKRQTIANRRLQHQLHAA